MAVIGSDWRVHSLLSVTPSKELSFVLPRNVVQKGELAEKEGGGRDGGMVYSRDTGLWVCEGMDDGMGK